MKHLCSQNSYPITQCVGSLGPTAHKGWQVNMFTTNDVFLSAVSCLSEIRFYLLYQKQIQLYADVSSTSSKIKSSCQILIINSSTKQKNKLGGRYSKIKLYFSFFIDKMVGYLSTYKIRARGYSFSSVSLVKQTILR